MVGSGALLVDSLTTPVGAMMIPVRLDDELVGALETIESEVGNAVDVELPLSGSGPVGLPMIGSVTASEVDLVTGWSEVRTVDGDVSDELDSSVAEGVSVGSSVNGSSLVVSGAVPFAKGFGFGVGATKTVL